MHFFPFFREGRLRATRQGNYQVLKKWEEEAPTSSRPPSPASNQEIACDSRVLAAAYQDDSFAGGRASPPEAGGGRCDRSRTWPPLFGFRISVEPATPSFPLFGRLCQGGQPAITSPTHTCRLRLVPIFFFRVSKDCM